MAKKKTAPPAEGTTASAPAAPPASETPAKATEPKKAKEPRKKESKAKVPAEAGAATPVAEAPVKTPATAPPAAATKPTAAPGDEAKKRHRQPGHPPSRGKKLKNHLRNLKQKLTKEGPLPIKRAIALLKQSKRAKFDETVEVHMSLGVDTTQTDQMVRGSVPLPFGIGKVVRVLFFCQGENVSKAKEAGADYAGSDELIKKIQQEGWLEFDVALATQDMMGQVSRLGKILGPRGLMPTPKAGTVVTAGGDVAAVVREFKAGKVEYRADKGGNVHAGVGKLSFDEEKLAANITTFVEQVRHAKPTGVKGNYVKSITVSATMSPGVPVSV
jgi:large subunit ribosomal protein L1